MFSRKKEKKVKQTIIDHLSVVCDTVNSMMCTIDNYVKGNYKEANDEAYKTHLAEGKADELRREIIETLYKGAFFPMVREDLVNYIAKQDKIADSAESCCDFIISQLPKVPEEFSEDLLRLSIATRETLFPLKDAVEHYFEDHKKIRSSIKEVNIKEEEADTLEWHLTEKIFQSKNIVLAEKMHLREFVFHIIHISDVIEDTADMLDSVVIKRSI